MDMVGSVAGRYDDAVGFSTLVVGAQEASKGQ